MATATRDQIDKRQYKTAPTTVTLVAGTSALSGTLDQNVMYSMTADLGTGAICFFVQGTSTASASASSNPLWNQERAEVFVGVASDDRRMAVYSAAASGTIYLTKLE